MGCKPSPVCAIVRIYSFERRSIYLDTTYISTPYDKYIDDVFTIVSCEEDAIELFKSIANEDPDGLLNWEIDFHKSPGDYIPFLGTSVSIGADGGLKFRYYRKKPEEEYHSSRKVSSSIKNKSGGSYKLLRNCRKKLLLF